MKNLEIEKSDMPLLRLVHPQPVKTRDQNWHENESMSPVNLDPAVIKKFLVSMVIFLITASCLTQWAEIATGGESIIVHKLMKFFSVDLELNAPAFFSTMLLLTASALLGLIAKLTYQGRHKDLLYWIVLALGFTAMAFDETIALHERLIEPVRAVIGETNLGLFYFAWVIPATALVGVLGIFFLRFLFRLPRKIAISFVAAAAVYIGASIGLELFEGRYAEIHGKTNVPYIALSTAEEALEMLSIFFFIGTLMKYISETFGPIRLSFDSKTEKA